MYSTKHKVHSKSDLGILSLHTGGAMHKGDPYTKPRGKSTSDDRFKGKQFTFSSNNEYFSKFPFNVQGKNDPYNEKISFLNLERKKGFGSSDPAKRDEFSHTIAINKHREAIANEKKSAKRFELKHPKVTFLEPLVSNESKSEEPSSTEPEFCEYDQVFGLTPDDDTIGNMTSVARIGRRLRRWKEKNPLMRTTCSDYGKNCDKSLKKYSKYARTKSTEQLYDKGHLHVECF